MPVTRIQRFYRNTGINADKIRLVRDIINQSWLAWAPADWGYDLYFPTEIIHLNKADDIPAVSSTFGPTTQHFCYFKSKSGRRLEVDATNRRYLRLDVRETNDEHGRPRDPRKLVATIEDALSLTPLHAFVNSAFVAHSFDDKAQHYSNELKLFLQLIGLTVFTGRSFAPESVAGKVKSRIAHGDVLFAVVTPQEDTTWITQELTRADTLNKSPFILKEQNAPFKSGLLGDREYITFSEGHISETFIPILEGLRQLHGDSPLP